MLASLAVICSCATPRQLWSARDAERQLTARVFSDGEQQWVEGGVRFDVVGELVVTHDAFAYAARRGDQWFVTASGERSYGPFDAVAELKLSPAHVAFAAQSAQGWRVVVDGAASRPSYFQAGVPHYWMADPVEKVLEVYRCTELAYALVLTAKSGQKVRAEPFDAVELRVDELFGGDPEDDE